jgi:ATP-dependent helicase IRC3
MNRIFMICIAMRKTTLVFCVNLAHVRDLTNTFREAGIHAAYVYSGTPAAERKALIRAFMQGELAVLLNCSTSSRV